MASADVLTSLRDHLTTRTGEGGDMMIPQRGVLWTILPPFPNVQEALERALKGDKRHIGVIMPQQDVLLKGARGPYQDNQPDGGAIRELHLTLTVFIRSLRLNPTSGGFLILTDWLDELARSYVYQGTYGALLKEVNYMGLPPDYLVVEGHVAIRYAADVSEKDWPKLIDSTLEFAWTGP